MTSETVIERDVRTLYHELLASWNAREVSGWKKSRGSIWRWRPAATVISR